MHFSDNTDDLTLIRSVQLEEGYIVGVGSEIFEYVNQKGKRCFDDSDAGGAGRRAARGNGGGNGGANSGGEGNERRKHRDKKKDRKERDTNSKDRKKGNAAAGASSDEWTSGGEGMTSGGEIGGSPSKKRSKSDKKKASSPVPNIKGFSPKAGGNRHAGNHNRNSARSSALQSARSLVSTTASQLRERETRDLPVSVKSGGQSRTYYQLAAVDPSNRSHFREDDIERACYYSAPESTKKSQLIDLLIDECLRELRGNQERLSFGGSPMSRYTGTANAGRFFSGSYGGGYGGGYSGIGGMMPSSAAPLPPSFSRHTPPLSHHLSLTLHSSSGNNNKNNSNNNNNCNTNNNNSNTFHHLNSAQPHSNKTWVDGVLRTVPLLAALPAQVPPVVKYQSANFRDDDYGNLPFGSPSHHHGNHHGKSNYNQHHPSVAPFGSAPFGNVSVDPNSQDPTSAYSPDSCRQAWRNVTRKIFKVQQCEESLEDESERNRVRSTAAFIKRRLNRRG